MRNLDAARRDWLRVIPSAIIRLAACRTPPWIRKDLRDEWVAELVAIIHGSSSPAAVRLLCGLRFAFGMLYAASRIGRSLESVMEGLTDPRQVAPMISHSGIEAERIRWVYLSSGVSAPRTPRRPGHGV
jgi:hypothetical protein